MKIRINSKLIYIIPMLFYIGIVFYLSEPKYIDYYKPASAPDTWDYVSIRQYRDGEVANGIVVQKDSTSFLVKSDYYSRDIFYRIANNNNEYWVVGKGTIYHKVNHFVGFNIMVVTQALIAFLIVALLISYGKAFL